MEVQRGFPLISGHGCQSAVAFCPDPGLLAPKSGVEAGWKVQTRNFICVVLRYRPEKMASSSKRRSTLTVLGVVVALGVGGTLAWRRASMTSPVTFRSTRVYRGSLQATVTATGRLNAVCTVEVGSH